MLTALILSTMSWQIYIDFKQAYNSSIREYFSDFFNTIDLLTYIGTIWIIIAQILGADFPNLMNQRLIAAFVLLMVWIKVFDWLRLF